MLVQQPQKHLKLHAKNDSDEEHSALQQKCQAI
jgi:hypothetical protein